VNTACRFGQSCHRFGSSRIGTLLTSGSAMCKLGIELNIHRLQVFYIVWYLTCAVSFFVLTYTVFYQRNLNNE
jgi:hypothetical protein